MLSVSSRIWTLVSVSIFYDDNHYTRIFLLDQWEKEEKEKERNNICWDENSSWTINLNWTFADTNAEIKSNHNLIKIVATISTKNKYKKILPEDVVKR